MIARFYIVLPYKILRIQNDGITPVRVQHNAGDAVVYPPQQTSDPAFSPQRWLQTSLIDVEGIQPTQEPTTLTYMESGAGRPYEANMLQVDLIRENIDRLPFFRTRGQPEHVAELSKNPLVRRAFGHANDVLARLQAVYRHPIIRPVTAAEDPFRVDFLDDEENWLEDDRVDGVLLQRMAYFFPTELSFITLRPEGWNESFNNEVAPELPLWDRLLIDARRLLPEVQPAILLIAMALEVCAEWVLKVLTPNDGQQSEMFEWLLSREPHYLQPNAEQKVTVVLKALCGSSLSDHPELLSRFRTIRKARNAIVHQGKSYHLPQARDFLSWGRQLTDWLVNVVPVDQRPAKVELPQFLVTTTLPGIRSPIVNPTLFIRDES